jgi:hypothetical protein
MIFLSIVLVFLSLGSVLLAKKYSKCLAQKEFDTTEVNLFVFLFSMLISSSMKLNLNVIMQDIYEIILEL